MAKTRNRVSRLTPIETDIERVERVPHTPQTEAPSYRLAFIDEEFLRSDEMRPVRLQLELQKFELIQQAQNIVSTVIMFGGARIPAPGQAPEASTEIGRKTLQDLSHYYEEARKFARLSSETSLRHDGSEFVVVTGGGPGIMEAGNMGAHEVGAKSIGLNIMLPHEQAPNRYVTPELCFNFHYFAIRKMHFLMRAKAIAIFPGGFGTLDELFEALTLIQTKRIAPMPILLFAPEFWKRIIDFGALRDAGTISPEDLDLFEFVETAEQAWGVVDRFYGLSETG